MLTDIGGSPMHKVLKVSFCDCHVFPCMKLNQNYSKNSFPCSTQATRMETAEPKLMKLGSDVPGMKLYQS